MTNFLIKLFIGANLNKDDPLVRKKCGFLSGLTGIFINLVLFIGKIFAGIFSGAISVVADSLNNLSDAGSSIVNIVGFKIALSPPDREHPFGHGRAEYVAGLIISFIITLMGVELARTSVEKIIFASVPEYDLFTVIILCISIALKFWMYIFNRKMGNMIDSVAMKATATDSISDVISTAAVLIGIAINYFAHLNADGYIGLLVSLFIVYSGIKTAKESLSPLLGQMPNKELSKNIKETVCSYDGIIGIHDLLIHNYGVGVSIISLHAEVPSCVSLSEAHALIDLIETELEQKFHCTATIHIDPVDVNDTKLDELLSSIISFIKSIEPSLSVHDFRLTGSTIHFDLVIPYKFNIGTEQLREEVTDFISQKDKALNPIINIERQMTELD